ncbi:MAG TPA: hypothetical protein VMG41_08275 [Gemmatimonadales bacterium]|nr:hypothetical protein [Gemmatimonadales bacterium]
MSTANYRLGLALVLLAAARPGAGQEAQLPALAFLGFEAGAPLASIDRQVAALGGSKLRCNRARRDRRVQECRGQVTDPVSRRSVELWLSAIDSATGVLTISSPLSGVELDAWRRTLETQFGPVGATVMGPQWSLQWVRGGRMLRLTWRIDNGAKVASVSLVDGHVLDAWGRERAQATRRHPPRPRAASP